MSMRRSWSLAACTLLCVIVAGTAGAGTNHTVIINLNNIFEPADLTIVEGDSVTWMNIGSGFHNVAQTGGGFRCAQGCDATGGNGNPSTANWSFTLDFNTVELVDYECEVHVAIGMVGTIDVLANEVFADGFESGTTGAWSSAVPAP